MARLPLIKVGVLGLGSDWQQSLQPAVTRMPARIRVLAVYDDVALAAMNAARAVNAEPVLGVRDLLNRNDLDALLVRGAGWNRDWLLEMVCERGLPVQLGPDVSLSEAQLQRFAQAGIEEGLLVIPELRLRYMPAALRLRELQATTLGPIHRVSIYESAWTLPFTDAPRLVHLMDWCDSLIERPAVAIERASHGRTNSEVTISFAPHKSGLGTRPIEVRLSGSRGEELSQDLLCEVVCDRGTVEILSPAELAWRSNGDIHREKLSADRTASEVVLDLFARRVLGALIPTPDLGDLQRARAAAAAVERLRTSAT